MNLKLQHLFGSFYTFDPVDLEVALREARIRDDRPWEREHCDMPFPDLKCAPVFKTPAIEFEVVVRPDGTPRCYYPVTQMLPDFDRPSQATAWDDPGLPELMDILEPYGLMAAVSFDQQAIALRVTSWPQQKLPEGFACQICEFVGRHRLFWITKVLHEGGDYPAFTPEYDPEMDIEASGWAPSSVLRDSNGRILCCDVAVLDPDKASAFIPAARLLHGPSEIQYLAKDVEGVDIDSVERFRIASYDGQPWQITMLRCGRNGLYDPFYNTRYGRVPALSSVVVPKAGCFVRLGSDNRQRRSPVAIVHAADTPQLFTPLRSASQTYENTESLEAFRLVEIRQDGSQVELDRHVRIDDLRALPRRDRSAVARSRVAELRRRFTAIYGAGESPSSRLTDENIEEAERLHLRIAEGDLVGIERAPVLGWSPSPGQETPDFIHIRLGEIAIEEMALSDPFHPADRYVPSGIELETIATHPTKNRILTRLIREIPGGIDAASQAFNHPSVRYLLTPS